MTNTKTLVIPILLITLGIGWLLTTLHVVENVVWIWTLGLALVGLLTFVLWGFNKVTLAVGPFFLLASFMSVLRQTGRLHENIELPVLVIAAGVLLLVVQHKSVPAPQWLSDAVEKTRGNDRS